VLPAAVRPPPSQVREVTVAGIRMGRNTSNLKVRRKMNSVAGPSPVPLSCPPGQFGRAWRQGLERHDPVHRVMPEPGMGQYRYFVHQSYTGFLISETPYTRIYEGAGAIVISRRSGAVSKGVLRDWGRSGGLAGVRNWRSLIAAMSVASGRAGQRPGGVRPPRAVPGAVPDRRSRSAKRSVLRAILGTCEGPARTEAANAPTPDSRPLCVHAITMDRPRSALAVPTTKPQFGVHGFRPRRHRTGAYFARGHEAGLPAAGVAAIRAGRDPRGCVEMP